MPRNTSGFSQQVMKVQCACGTKYAFDVTPEMLRSPRTFVCQTCGRDNSAAVNELIRQAYGVTGAPTPAVASAPAQPPAAPPPPPPPPRKAGPIPVRVAVPQAQGAAAQSSSAGADRPKPALQPDTLKGGQQTAPKIRIQQESAKAHAESASGSAEVPGVTSCLKHPGQMAAQKCMVCQKPICPKCMEMFGYVCSAYCKGKAEAEKLDIPVYAGQKSVAERKYWRKAGLIAGVVVLVVGGFLGAWTWYAWIGSAPRVAFSVRLENPGYSGQVRMAGSDQLVFLHGGRVGRHDMKANKQVWLHDLVDRKKIAKQAADAWEPIRTGKRLQRVEEPTEEEIREDLERWAAAAFKLYAQGSNIWISSGRKLTRFDWDTGQPGKEIALEGAGKLVTEGNELLMVSTIEPGYQVIQHVDLVSGESRKEEIGQPSEELLLARLAIVEAKSQKTAARTTGRKPTGTTAVASRSGSDQPPVTIAKASLAGANTKALNPAQVASEVQSLSKPERIALPAVLAANANQQRLLAQMEDLDEDTDMAAMLAGLRANMKGGKDQQAVIRDGQGFVQFEVKLLEKKEIARQAMKAAPQKSVLDGDLRVTQTAELANEMLNEMQRDRTGGLEVEDVSRYQVTLGRIGEKSTGWTAEVIGPPKFISVKTVNVVTAGKTLIVLDKNNKKMWESQLGFPIETSFVSEFDDEDTEEQEMSYGDGPCVEREGTLYVFDQGVLTAFELANGNARWRLPSVGISGLHFDAKGMLYVNTTTASPESLKYSQQIDVTDKTYNMVMKIDPASGKTLWSITGEGLINHVSGKFIYTIESGSAGTSALVELIRGGSSESSGYLRIKRINPSNGRIMWEHFQQRAPLDIQINGNTFQVLFKKEMQVLKFIAL